MLGDTAGGGVTVPEIPPLMSQGGQYFCGPPSGRGSWQML